MIEKLIAVVFSTIALGYLYLILVVIPVILYTETQCLKAGYPVASVSIDLEQYCSNVLTSVPLESVKK